MMPIQAAAHVWLVSWRADAPSDDKSSPVMDGMACLRVCLSRRQSPFASKKHELGSSSLETTCSCSALDDMGYVQL
jgi:hypothetical protein